MAPLTWRNVDAPDLSAAANMMARASDGVQKAFKAGGDIGRGIHGDKVEIGSRDAMLQAAKITDSEGWQTAMKNGTAFGNIDPRYINQETIAWGMSREKDLLAMENARAAEARAASAAAGRASGGGGTGGGGSGRRGGGGSSGKGSSETDKWAVTEAQGALRLAIAEHGEGSPEATAAANALAGVSAATESKGGYLDAVDAVGAGITAEKAEAAAAGEAAVAALGEDPYATPYTPAFEIPGQTIPGVAEAVAAPSGSLPVPNATAPGGPLPQEAPAPSPVAGLGYSMGTDVPVQETAAVPADFPVSADRPALSFGQDVPAADVGAVSNDRPVSWGDYAEERLAEEPAPASSGSTLDPVELGFNKEVVDRPEWKAFKSEVADFQSYFGARNEELAANRERGFDALTAPRDVKTAIDSSRAILDTTLKANPEFALYDNIPKLKGLQAEGGPEAVVGEVVKALGVQKDDAEGMMEEIMNLAASNGVDIPTAASAIMASAGPANRDVATSWYDISNVLSGNTYYDPDKAASLLEASKAVTDDPAGNISNRNAVGGVRSTLSGLEAQYESSRKAVISAEAALAKRPDDRALQEAAQTARAQLLETDKNIVEFTRLLPDQLAEMGMKGGPGRRATTPEIPQALIDADNEMTANMAEYGTKTPGFVGFRNNTFMDGSVSPDSPFGQRQANQWLPAVMSGRATEQEQTSFFDWVAKSPETNAEVFGKLQEMDYLGENLNLPESVQAAYEEFSAENAPAKAIQDFSSLGFDVAQQPEVAAALANDPEVKTAMERWNNAQSFFTLPGTLKRAEEAAKESIRIALSRDKATEE
jgi:hypothetical protein